MWQIFYSRRLHLRKTNPTPVKRFVSGSCFVVWAGMWNLAGGYRASVFHVFITSHGARRAGLIHPFTYCLGSTTVPTGWMAANKVTDLHKRGVPVHVPVVRFNSRPQIPSGRWVQGSSPWVVEVKYICSSLVEEVEAQEDMINLYTSISSRTLLYIKVSGGVKVSFLILIPR